MESMLISLLEKMAWYLAYSVPSLLVSKERHLLAGLGTTGYFEDLENSPRSLGEV